MRPGGLLAPSIFLCLPHLASCASAGGQKEATLPEAREAPQKPRPASAPANARSVRPSDSSSGDRAVERQPAGPPLLDRELCEGILPSCVEATRAMETADQLLSTTSLAFGEGGEPARRAASQLEAALSTFGSSDVLLFRLCRAQLSAGQAEPAMAELAGLSQRYPDDAEVQGAYGVALVASGQVEPARQAFLVAVRLQPDVAERWIALGTTQMLLGRSEEAERSYRKALSLSPGDAKAHGDLGALLVLAARFEEGIAHLDRALSLEPTHASYRSNLAYAWLCLGDEQKALEQARAALQIDPSLVSGWLNLGLAWVARGDYAEARKAFERARALSPSDPRPEQNLEDLAELEARAARGSP